MSLGGDLVTGPLPIQSVRPSWRQVFAIFRLRNFRHYELSMFASSLATWTSRIAVDWLMLQLTGNFALVGLAVALQFGPTIVFGTLGGIIADRFPRRSIVILTQSVTAGGSGCLALLVILGAVEVWHVFLVVVVAGIAGAIETPARVTLLGQIVDPGRFRTGVSINATVFHLGGLIGPVVSGVLIALVGSGWSIGVSVLGSLAGVLAFVLIRQRELSVVSRPPAGEGGVRVAARYLVRKPTILWPTVLVAFIASFGMTLPVLFTAAAADEGFGTGSAGYGLYTSLAAVGAIAGALASTRRRSVRLRAIVGINLAYGLVIVLGGLSPLYAVFLAAAVALGFFRLMFMTGAESMVQLSSNPGIRGRVMAIYFVVLVGGQAVGGLLMGWIAETFGMLPAFAIAGGVPALAALVVGIILARRHQLRIAVNLRDFRRVVRIVKRPRPRPQGRETSPSGLSSSAPSQRSEHSTDSAP